MHSINTLVIGSIFALCSGPALAGFDVTRMTTVVDDFAGSYTVTTSSRLEPETSTVGIAQADFSSFHLRGESGTLNGFIVDEFERQPGSVESTASGNLTFERAADPENGSEASTLTLGFEGLRAERGENGVEISGAVSVNGEVFDADELPGKVGGLLRRLFWLIRR